MKNVSSLIIFLLYFIIKLCVTQIIDDETVKELSNGSLLKGKKIITKNNDTTYAFLGIPYAEAPVAEMRYRSPQPIAKWAGILDATYYKVACTFNSSNKVQMAQIQIMSEDCLQLNVFASKSCAKSSKCPVMVHIDSAVYEYGSVITMQPEGIVDMWAYDGIVVVTMNFRTGSFGFLNALDEKIAIKNAGLLDQIEALKWIQKEINRFGGDQNRVTLIGMGSGSINVDQLSLSPLTNGLFHQLALLGGSASMMSYIDQFSNYLSTVKLGEATSCNNSLPKQNTAMSMADTVKCLRTRKASEILKAQQFVEKQSLLYNFRLPALDDDQKQPIFPTTIMDLLKYRKRYNMLIGNIENEIDWLKAELNYNRIISVKSLCRVLLKFRHLPTSDNLVDSCNQQYSHQTKREEILNDVGIYIPIYETAYYNTRNGGKTFLFEVSTTSDGDSSDNSDLFHTTFNQLPNNPLYISLKNFIKFGNPSSDSMKWQEFSVERNNFARISSKSAPKSEDGYHNSAIMFWVHGGINGTMNEKTMNATEQGTISELKAILAGLVDDIIEGTKKIGSESRTLTQELITKMQNLSNQLNSTIDELIVAQKNDDYQEFMQNLTALTNDRTRACSSEPETDGATVVADSQFTDAQVTTTEKSIAKMNPKWNATPPTSIHLVMPVSVLRLMDDVSHVLQEVLMTLKNSNNMSIILDVFNDVDHSKSSATSSIEPILRQSILQSLLATTISEGKQVLPTLPTLTIYKSWMDDVWFWIIHAVVVIILVALIVAIVALNIKLSRRKQYEQLS